MNGNLCNCLFACDFTCHMDCFCTEKLAIMDENINHSMNQIGVQLSSRFDALLSLLDFTKKYAGYEAQTLTDEVNEKRCIIMETSTPEEVLRQESVINEVLFRTQTVLEEYPGSTDENEYIKCMDAVECYEKIGADQPADL